MRSFFGLFLLFLATCGAAFGQACTPQGDQTTEGTGNIWIGYVYDNADLTNYRGYVNEGTSASPNFDQSFGGSNTTYATNGCGVQTEYFSVRYKLNRNFTAGSYQIVVGADDGYRLSVDGGANWVINNWNPHSYTTNTVTLSLSGTTHLVLEYFENAGDNRVSFNMTQICMGTENTAVYGTNNVWRGYIYDGTNFDLYSGVVTEGTSSSPNFNETFGGDNVNYVTSACAVQTETFSARYRLAKTVAAGTYSITVGADDGYRFSTDGGANWIINNWQAQSYTATSTSVNLAAGTYNFVLEYYEQGGANRVSFNMTTISILPITLLNFEGKLQNNQAKLSWNITPESTPKQFGVERAGSDFIYHEIGTVAPQTETKAPYQFTDANPLNGRANYRLRMTDENGKVTYSGSISLVSTSSTTWKVFPTLLTTQFVQVIPGKSANAVTAQVADMNGRVVLKKALGAVQKGNQLQVDLSTIASRKGMYTLQLISDDHTEVARVVIP